MADVEFIQTPNTLRKAKIGSGPGKLDKNLLAEAEKAIEAFGEGFTDWLQEDLDNMEAARLQLSQGENPERALADLYRIALDLKGQGTSFGYDVVSAVGGSLTDFMLPIKEAGTTLTPLQLEVVTAHVGAIRAVFSEELKGDGGATGQALLNGLARIVVKANAASAR
jgi:chemotaxis protein histidine kinase CheA